MVNALYPTPIMGFLHYWDKYNVLEFRTEDESMRNRVKLGMIRFRQLNSEMNVFIYEPLLSIC